MHRFAREVVEALLLGALIFLLTRQVIQTFRVEQRSMEPTLHEGQYLVVSRLAYAELDLGLPLLQPTTVHAAEGALPVTAFSSPERGDIVVFTNPLNPSQHLIKRVIGLPGDSILIEGGRVFINGTPLDEPYLFAPTRYRLGPQEVPPNHLFVLGDNRNNSFDSHQFGPIHRRLLIGKVYVLPFVWPTPAWSRLPEFPRI